MKQVNEVPEVVGRAVARGRRKVAAHLVSPGPVKWVLHYREQLDVREAKAHHVLDELGRDLAVGERPMAILRGTGPRSKVHLIDRHRRTNRIGGSTRAEPGLVLP